jgi:hypothetical protein
MSFSLYIKRPQIWPGVGLLLGVSLLVLYPWKKSGAQRASLAINFVTITNVSGTNLAIFTLSNPGGPPIEVGLPPEIELRNTTRNDPGRVVTPALVHSGQPLTVTIVAPKTREQWRMVLGFYRPDLRDRLSRISPRVWRWIGRRSVVVTSNAHSEWVAPAAPAEESHL